MTIMTILAGLSGGTASNGACDLACCPAILFRAMSSHYMCRLTSPILAAGAERLAATATMRWAMNMPEPLAARRQ